MRVTVQVDEDGELWLATEGYRGQPAEVLVPLLASVATAALQRLHKLDVPGKLAVAIAPAVVGAAPVVVDEAPRLAPVADLVAPPVTLTGPAAAPPVLEPAAAPEARPAPAPRRAARGRRAPARQAATAAAAASRTPPRPPLPSASASAVDALDAKRLEALRMLDDGQDYTVIADELAVSSGQVRRWDRDR